MGEEQVQAGMLRQGWQLLQLGLVVLWVVVAGACGSTGSSVSARGTGGEQGPLPTPEDGELLAVGPVWEKAHHYYDEARRTAVRGKWKEAIVQYDQAIALQGSYVAAYKGRAAAYHALGKHQEAIRDYDRAIEIQGTSRLYTERGHVLLESGSYAQARQDYHMALSLGPLPPAAYMGLGDAHRAMGELEEAVQAYSEAIALDPDNWQGYYYRGAGYFSLRQFQQALEDFERVIAIQPHAAGAYYSRGVLRWLGGKCAEALVDFQVFIALFNDREALLLSQQHVEYPLSTTRCEPSPYVRSLVAIRDTASSTLRAA